MKHNFNVIFGLLLTFSAALQASDKMNQRFNKIYQKQAKRLHLEALNEKNLTPGQKRAFINIDKAAQNHDQRLSQISALTLFNETMGAKEWKLLLEGLKQKKTIVQDARLLTKHEVRQINQALVKLEAQTKTKGILIDNAYMYLLLNDYLDFLFNNSQTDNSFKFKEFSNGLREQYLAIVKEYLTKEDPALNLKTLLALKETHHQFNDDMQYNALSRQLVDLIILNDSLNSYDQNQEVADQVYSYFQAASRVLRERNFQAYFSLVNIGLSLRFPALLSPNINLPVKVEVLKLQNSLQYLANHSGLTENERELLRVTSTELDAVLLSKDLPKALKQCAEIIIDHVKILKNRSSDINIFKLNPGATRQHTMRFYGNLFKSLPELGKFVSNSQSYMEKVFRNTMVQPGYKQKMLRSLNNLVNELKNVSQKVKNSGDYEFLNNAYTFESDLNYLLKQLFSAVESRNTSATKIAINITSKLRRMQRGQLVSLNKGDFDLLQKSLKKDLRESLTWNVYLTDHHALLGAQALMIASTGYSWLAIARAGSLQALMATSPATGVFAWASLTGARLSYGTLSAINLYKRFDKKSIGEFNHVDWLYTFTDVLAVGFSFLPQLPAVPTIRNGVAAPTMLESIRNSYYFMHLGAGQMITLVYGGLGVYEYVRADEIAETMALDGIEITPRQIRVSALGKIVQSFVFAFVNHSLQRTHAQNSANKYGDFARPEPKSMVGRMWWKAKSYISPKAPYSAKWNEDAIRPLKFSQDKAVRAMQFPWNARTELGPSYAKGLFGYGPKTAPTHIGTRWYSPHRIDHLLRMTSGALRASGKVLVFGGYSYLIMQEIPLLSTTNLDSSMRAKLEKEAPLPDLKANEIAVRAIGFSPNDLLYPSFKSTWDNRSALKKFGKENYLIVDFLSPEDLFNQLVEISKTRGKKIRYLEINTHGLPGAMWTQSSMSSWTEKGFSAKSAEGYITLDWLNSKGIKEAFLERPQTSMKNVMAENARVILVSCLVGSDYDEGEFENTVDYKDSNKYLKYVGLADYDLESPENRMIGTLFTERLADYLLINGGRLDASTRIILGLDAGAGSLAYSIFSQEVQERLKIEKPPVFPVTPMKSIESGFFQELDQNEKDVFYEENGEDAGLNSISMKNIFLPFKKVGDYMTKNAKEIIADNEGKPQGKLYFTVLRLKSLIMNMPRANKKYGFNLKTGGPIPAFSPIRYKTIIRPVPAR